MPVLCVLHSDVCVFPLDVRRVGVSDLRKALERRGHHRDAGAATLPLIDGLRGRVVDTKAGGRSRGATTSSARAIALTAAHDDRLAAGRRDDVARAACARDNDGCSACRRGPEVEVAVGGRAREDRRSGGRASTAPRGRGLDREGLDAGGEAGDPVRGGGRRRRCRWHAGGAHIDHLEGCRGLGRRARARLVGRRQAQHLRAEGRRVRAAAIAESAGAGDINRAVFTWYINCAVFTSAASRAGLRGDVVAGCCCSIAGAGRRYDIRKFFTSRRTR
mmetsp:Transcript_105126/g.304113  ORF Transcript_105126/g.304113 Transcript_105126/m.304113 type:complete len:275 (-) Transcript_105126:1027-1851(-)